MSCDKNCCSGSRTAAQSLEEMEHQRGLWGAAMDGNLDRVRELLQKRHDPNRQDQYGYTALHYAARSGHPLVVAELLSNGACLRKRTNGGATPAHRAAFAGHKETLNLLIELMEIKGEAVTITDDDGDTVAHKAAKGGHGSLAEELVNRFPQLDPIKNRRGHSWKEVA